MSKAQDQGDALHRQRTLARFGELALRSSSLDEILHGREVYLRDVELRRDVLTAYERFRPE